MCDVDDSDDGMRDNGSLAATREGRNTVCTMLPRISNSLSDIAYAIPVIRVDCPPLLSSLGRLTCFYAAASPTIH